MDMETTRAAATSTSAKRRQRGKVRPSLPQAAAEAPERPARRAGRDGVQVQFLDELKYLGLARIRYRAAVSVI